MTRWHGSTGQRRRTYRVSGCIASAFARPVVCSLRRQSARGLCCCCCCVPSPAAQCNACQKAISQANQIGQFPSYPRQHSVSLQLVFLHSLPIIAGALLPNAQARKLQTSLFPRPSPLSYRRHARYLPREAEGQEWQHKAAPGSIGQ